MKVKHAARGVRRGGALAGLGLLLVAASGARAADVRLDVRYGFDGAARVQRWTPVTVELTNSGPERQGLLVLKPADRRLAAGLQQSVVAVRLPQGSHQRHLMFWPDYGGIARPVAVFAGVVSPEPAVSVIDETQSLLVAVGFPPGALGYLSRVQRVRLSFRSAMGPGQPPVTGNIVPAHIPPGHLPESALAYPQVDLLVLGPLFASDISQGAQVAIASWVRTGGDLVITGGADAARLGDAFFRDLLPVEGLTAGSTTIRTGLQAFGISVAQPTPVTIGVPKPGAQVIAQQRGVPLIVRGRVGSGSVTFFAFDPTAAPVAVAVGLEKLWVPLFRDRPRMYSLQEGADDIGLTLYNGVTNIKAMKTPPLLAVVGFLGLYFLLLIPVNYWVLARRKRRELAWVTTPIIVALFFVGAYGFGYTVKGPKLLVNQRTLVEAGEGSREALALTSFGIFSPARRRYDIRIAFRGALVSDAGERWPGMYSYGPGPFGQRQESGLIHDELDPWVEGAQIAMWGMRGYTALGVLDMGGPVRSSLRVRGLGLAGWIENDTRWPLKDVLLVSPGARMGAELGDLEPGQRVEVGGAGRPAPGTRRLQGEVEMLAAQRLLPPTRLMSEVGIMARVAQSLIPVDIGRPCERTAVTRLLVRLPVESAGGPMNVAGGAYTAASDAPGGTLPVSLGSDPDAVFTFSPPADLVGLRVQALTISSRLTAQGGRPPFCDIYVYNCRTRGWEKVGSLPQRQSAPTKPVRARPLGLGRAAIQVHDPARFVGRDGIIKVRLVRRADVPYVEVQRLDLAVAGQR